MKSLTRAWREFDERPWHTRGARILQIALGLMLAFRLLTEAAFADFLWGPQGVGQTAGGGTGFELERLFFATRAGTYTALSMLALGACGLILGRWTRCSTAVALLAFTLLGLRLPDLCDGGDNVTQLVLIYMLFLLPAGAKAARNSPGVWLHNVAVAAIIAQVIVLYATSGFLKVTGEVWQNGTAMYQISQVQGFSLPALSGYFTNPLVTTLATYAAMFFQVWFPVAIFSRFKLPWILTGMFFHVGIAVYMGLITFSTVMVGLELFLISDAEYGRLGRRLKLLRNRVVRRLRPKAIRAIPTHCKT
jgi:hypothetical protein